MAKTKISEFSSTPANNTDIDSINIAEGCAPSNINDAIRELMAQLKDFQTGAVGDSFNGPIGTTTAAAGAFTTLSASSTVTLSGGTANGVTYLNGSKVLTSGSALTFDGTNLGVGATTVAARVDIVGGADNQFRLSSNETNATTKEAKFLIRHYTNAQPNFLVMYPYSTSTDNAVFYGGGSNAQTAATYHAWMTAANNTTVSGTEQMRLTSTGLGIGTSSPSTKLTVYDATTPQVTFNNGTSTFIVGNNSGGNNKILYGTGAYPMIFYTNALEAMRIDSSQNLLVGTTSVNFAGSGFTLSTNSGTTKWLAGPISGTAGNFYIASSGTTGVYLNGTAATSWSSNSDERLKTDLKPIENAAEKVASLRAVTGRYKTDEEGYSRAFLIAQDVQAVLPEAVAPTTMYDGTEVLGLAYTETIPLLVAAIQELKAEFDAYKASHP